MVLTWGNTIRRSIRSEVACELATNSVLHSDSRKPGGTFTVRAEVHEGDYVYVEVQDNGGPWREPTRTDGRPHGLDIVRELSNESGRDGDALAGWVVWARHDWPARDGRHRPVRPAPQR